MSTAVVNQFSQHIQIPAATTPGCNQPGAVLGNFPTELTPHKLRSLGVLWPPEVDRICDEETYTPFLIEDFLPAKSIAIVAGDSTIGKSPLMCQLGLSVAAGTPFLGMKTKTSRVLYCDLENSLRDHQSMRNALTGFLGLTNVPDGFLLMPESDGLETAIKEASPSLVVIDSLRSFRPEVTEKNTIAGEWLKEIRKLTRKYGCSFLFVHHLRKPGEHSFGCDLTERVRVATWLLEMEGPRALVNQTDVRVAVAGGDGNPAALKLRWSRRVHGDSPLVLLERIYDDGEPIGYRHLTGAGLLSPERRDALSKLPDPPAEFSFKDAKAATGLPDNRLGEFLTDCRQLGLLEKLGRSRYKKTTRATDVGQGGGVSGALPQVPYLQVDATPEAARSIGGV